MQRIDSRISKQRAKLVALQQYSDKTNSKVLDTWVALLAGLQDLSPKAQVLANLLADEYAFTLAHPVTIDTFLTKYLGEDTNDHPGFSAADRPAFSAAMVKAAKDNVPRLQGLFLERGLVLEGIESLPRLALSKRLDKAMQKNVQTYLGSLELLRVVRRWFNGARNDLQRTLLQEQDTLPYVLFVESVPAAYTDVGAPGYIIPGTVRALEYFLGRDTNLLARRKLAMTSRRAALSAVAGPASGRAKAKKGRK